MKKLTYKCNVMAVDLNSMNYEMSMAWKKCSKKLFDDVQNKYDFRTVLHWCGTYSSVTRTVPKKTFDAFSDWLYTNLDAIKRGSLDFLNLQTNSFLTKIPTSWISKVCHIINPHDYPIIWDSHSRDMFSDDWKNAFDDAKKACNGWSDEEIYSYDSKIWSGKK